MKKLILILIFSGSVTGVEAQTEPLNPSSTWTQETVNASRRAVVIILKKIRPNLPPDKQHLADPDRVRVAAYGNFYAYYDADSGQINVPFGIWHGFRLLAWAALDAYDEPALTPFVKQYTQLVALNVGKFKADSPSILLPDFRTWAKLPQRQRGSETEERIRTGKEISFMVEAMAFVISHELVHLIEKHPPSGDVSSERSKWHETLADQKGFQIFKASGFDMLAAANALVFLGMTKLNVQGELIQVSTHPHPFCRTYKTFTVPIHERRKDPAFIDGAKRAGYDSVESLIRDLLVMKEAC